MTTLDDVAQNEDGPPRRENFKEGNIAQVTDVAFSISQTSIRQSPVGALQRKNKTQT